MSRRVAVVLAASISLSSGCAYRRPAEWYDPIFDHCDDEAAIVDCLHAQTAYAPVVIEKPVEFAPTLFARIEAVAESKHAQLRQRGWLNPHVRVWIYVLDQSPVVVAATVPPCGENCRVYLAGQASADWAIAIEEALD